MVMRHSGRSSAVRVSGRCAHFWHGFAIDIDSDLSQIKSASQWRRLMILRGRRKAAASKA
jgi:hypothetical protein